MGTHWGFYPTTAPPVVLPDRGPTPQVSHQGSYPTGVPLGSYPIGVPPGFLSGRILVYLTRIPPEVPAVPLGVSPRSRQGSQQGSQLSPSGSLLGDVHEAHVVRVAELAVRAPLALEAWQGGLLHAGLLPQEGPSGGRGASQSPPTPPGARR